MNSSAGDPDDGAHETMPLELLPLHQGLEADGSSWRAALPQPENLLRRVTARASLKIRLVHKTSPAPTPTPSMHHRPKQERH